MKVVLLVAAGAAALTASRPETPSDPRPATFQAGDDCCVPSAAPLAQPAVTRRGIHDETAGSIRGTIVWEGDKPEPNPPLVIGEKESAGCDHDGKKVDTTDQTLMIGPKGGVANVVLTLEAEGVEVTIPGEPIALDQMNCRFEPHVIVVPQGATLRFENSDPVNHNIHTYSKKNQAINKNVSGGSNSDQKLDNDETFEVKCDIHPWMKGYVIVTDATHWAVSGSDGSFKIEGVPAGTYKLSWWHESLGKGKTEEVTVTAGKVSELTHKVGEESKSSRGRRRR